MGFTFYMLLIMGGENPILALEGTSIQHPKVRPLIKRMCTNEGYWNQGLQVAFSCGFVYQVTRLGPA